MGTTYDVVVVGSGPSGSTAARELAERGLSTLLLDKEEFPRDKPCGGGITVRTADLLPFSIEPVTERLVSSVQFSYRMSEQFRYSSPLPLVHMTQRSRFDALLTEKAVAAGAALQDGSALRSFEVDSKGVTVRTDRGTFRAGLVVGADGANGITARSAGLDRHVMSVAFEGNARFAGNLTEDWQDTLGLDLGGVPGGYGWIFPKGDHLNVGVGGWRLAIGPRIRDHLSALSEYYRLPDRNLFGLRGHHLPMRRSGSRIAGDRVLLLGDAAGLVDPLSGEGIYGAVRSAQIAAPHIASFLAGGVPDLGAYEREIDRVLMPEMDASRKFQFIFHHRPGLYMRAFHTNRWFWKVFCRVVRGDTTYDRIIDRLGPLHVLVDGWAAFAQRRLAGITDG